MIPSLYSLAAPGEEKKDYELELLDDIMTACDRIRDYIVRVSGAYADAFALLRDNDIRHRLPEPDGDQALDHLRDLADIKDELDVQRDMISAK